MHRVPDPADLWERVARLGFLLRRKGVNGAGIPDLLIAVTAATGDAAVFSLDAHFSRIAGVFPVSLL